MSTPRKLVTFLETNRLQYEPITHIKKQSSLAKVHLINCTTTTTQFAKVIVCKIDNDRASLLVQPAYGFLYCLLSLLSEHFDRNKDIYFKAGTHTDILKVPYKEFNTIEKPYRTNFSRSISRTLK